MGHEIHPLLPADHSGGTFSIKLFKTLQTFPHKCDYILECFMCCMRKNLGRVKHSPFPINNYKGFAKTAVP